MDVRVRVHFWKVRVKSDIDTAFEWKPLKPTFFVVFHSLSFFSNLLIYAHGAQQWSLELAGMMVVLGLRGVVIENWF